MAKILKIGITFELHERRWTLTGFREGLPLITCEATGQINRVSDQTLQKFILEDQIQ